jgi:hypothetical protein
MGYIRKGSTVANPAKKSLTVFQNSATRTVPVYTNVTGYVGISDRGCANCMNVPVTFYGVTARYDSYAQGSGYHNYGTVTVAPGGSWAHMYSRYASGSWSSANWHYSYAMVGNRRFGYNQVIANVGTVQTGSRTETYWNTKWSKRSA